MSRQNVSMESINPRSLESGEVDVKTGWAGTRDGDPTGIDKTPCP
jgi:hypothetical protein